MKRRAFVCWPRCSAEVLEAARGWVEANGAEAKQYVVAVDKAEHLESLLVQAYAGAMVGSCGTELVEAMGEHVSGMSWSTGKPRATCLAWSGEDLPDAYLPERDAFLAGDEEAADRVERAFARPMLTYDGFRGAQTCDLVRQLLEIRRAHVEAGVRDALYYGDVAMLCYGLRKAREGKAEVILPGGKAATKAQVAWLAKTGVRAWPSMAEWQRDNDVLVQYHGVNMASVVAEDHVFFMGLMIPTAAVSLDISRARTGGPESRVQLLDAMLLKSLVGSKQPLPCVFGDLVSDVALSYSPRLTKLAQAYSQARDEVRAKVCEAGDSPDFSFDVRSAPGGAKEEIEKAHEVQAAAKDMPVVPMYYGVLDCGGHADAKIAVEPFDMTLATWMRTPRTLDSWLEVLSRAAWCVTALYDVAKMRHDALDASHVLIRVAEGKRAKRAAPVRLDGAAMPQAHWDVRLTGVDKMEKVPDKDDGKDGAGLQSLASDIMKGADVPKDVRTLLNKMRRQSLKDTVKMLANVLRSAARQGQKKKTER